MRDTTLSTRAMNPPIMFHECPAYGGHLWARVNPRWVSDSRSNPQSDHKRWCPEHEAEKKDHVAQALSERQVERMEEYAALPLPSSRRCTNPDPKTHRPRAVLPSGRFYRRKSKKKIDGEYNTILDSQCKACRRAQEIARRDRRRARDPEAYAKSERDRSSKHNAKRRAPVKQGKNRLDPAPLIAHVNGTPASVFSESTMRGLNRVKAGESKTVDLALVDRILFEMGDEHMLTLLYPD